MSITGFSVTKHYQASLYVVSLEFTPAVVSSHSLKVWTRHSNTKLPRPHDMFCHGSAHGLTNRQHGGNRRGKWRQAQWGNMAANGARERKAQWDNMATWRQRPPESARRSEALCTNCPSTRTVPPGRCWHHHVGVATTLMLPMCFGRRTNEGGINDKPRAA